MSASREPSNDSTRSNTSPPSDEPPVMDGDEHPNFGWPLRDPPAAQYERLGLTGLWLSQSARKVTPSSRVAPLLLVHGAHHGAWCYGGYLEAFEEAGVPAAAIDLRGHGALIPEGLATSTSISDYAEDVCLAAEWLEARHGRPPVILGHSLGGLIVAVAATRRPASGLVLIAPSPPGNLHGAAAVPAVPTDVLRAPPSDAEVHSRFLGGLPVPDLRAWAQRLGPESPTAMNERYTLSVPVDFAALRGLPGLCIEAGIEDASRHPPGQDEAIARAYGIEYRLLPQAPHCLMTGPSGEESASLILDWWRSSGFDTLSGAK